MATSRALGQTRWIEEYRAEMRTALGHLDKAAALAPGYADIAFRRAQALRYLGEPDAALDAGKRVSRALTVLPRELRQLTELFLMPEDHPFSLERVAAIVKEDRRAAAYGIRIALSLLARHYGYAS